MGCDGCTMRSTVFSEKRKINPVSVVYSKILLDGTSNNEHNIIQDFELFGENFYVITQEVFSFITLRVMADVFKNIWITLIKEKY